MTRPAASGSARPCRAARGRRPTPVEVRDSVGNLLADGDQVTLIKDLTVKGAGQTLKRGTLIKSIRLTGDAQEIDCKFDGIKGLVLRAEFVRKRVTMRPPRIDPSWDGAARRRAGLSAAMAALACVPRRRGGGGQGDLPASGRTGSARSN